MAIMRRILKNHVECSGYRHRAFGSSINYVFFTVVQPMAIRLFSHAHRLLVNSNSQPGKKTFQIASKNIIYLFPSEETKLSRYCELQLSEGTSVNSVK